MLDVNVPLPTTLRCPTCRAAQEWSDTCRRCKCDLRLLRGVAAAYQAAYAACLAELQRGRTREAFAAARRCVQCWPRPESHRLLAVCAMLQGDWPAALASAKAALALDQA